MIFFMSDIRYCCLIKSFLSVTSCRLELGFAHLTEILKYLLSFRLVALVKIKRLENLNCGYFTEVIVLKFCFVLYQ